MSSVRVAWKGNGNQRDEYYICKLTLRYDTDAALTWLQTATAFPKFGKFHEDFESITLTSMAQRYSSEITGTIIVQCIPILRPIIRDIHTSLTSQRFGSKQHRSVNMAVGDIKSNTLVRSKAAEQDAESSESMREFMLHEFPQGSNGQYNAQDQSFSEGMRSKDRTTRQGAWEDDSMRWEDRRSV